MRVPQPHFNRKFFTFTPDCFKTGKSVSYWHKTCTLYIFRADFYSYRQQGKKPQQEHELALSNWKQMACLPYREGSPIA
jgi:hypothetical protein